MVAISRQNKRLWTIRATCKWLLRIQIIRESAYAPLNPRWANRVFNFYFEVKMTREEKLEAIYKEMANKKLKLWCKCKSHNWENVIFIRKNRGWEYLFLRKNKEFMIPLWYSPKIIWHPVMIGDVLDWVDEHNKSVRTWMLKYEKVIVYFWWNKKEPIDKQSDECIDYVYSLIQK